MPDIELCDYEGAMRLKRKLEEYWLERGYSVTFKLVEAPFVSQMRMARYDVRSDDIKNGIPLPRCRIRGVAHS